MRYTDIPPIRCLVQARKQLDDPGPKAQPIVLRVDAGPEKGFFAVMFVPRQYSTGKWVWEISSSQHLDLP